MHPDKNIAILIQITLFVIEVPINTKPCFQITVFLNQGWESLLKPICTTRPQSVNCLNWWWYSVWTFLEMNLNFQDGVWNIVFCKTYILMCMKSILNQEMYIFLGAITSCFNVMHIGQYFYIFLSSIKATKAKALGHPSLCLIQNGLLIVYTIICFMVSS